MSKKALVILSRYLWPVDGGRKESLNHYLKELHDHYNYEVTVLCFLEATQKINEADKTYYIHEVHALKDVDTKSKLSNLFKHTFSKDKWPLQCSLYYSKENEDIIRKYVTKLSPDLIFTEMIRTCTYYDAFKNSDAIKLANLDDLLSIRYKRQSEATNTKASVAGAYNDKLPKFARRIASSPRLKKFVLRMESDRCGIWEKKSYELYDYSLMTSDIERDKLNEMMQDSKAKTLSVGVDVEYYSQPMNGEKDPIGLSYVGNFKVAANVDTLDMIANQILPKLKSDFRFYVIGSCPENIQNLYADNNRIVFCGRVEDLREYVKKAVVFLSPIAYGTGVKTKIVEAMAMGMPVVTNSVGAEGISAINDKDFVVRETPEEIAEATDRILNDKELAVRIGKQAQKFANSTFCWEKIFRVYKEMNL